MSLFHRHRWTPVDVQHARHTLFGQGEVTVILRRCRCDRFDTETVAGHWPVERFLPNEASPVSKEQT